MQQLMGDKGGGGAGGGGGVSRSLNPLGVACNNSSSSSSNLHRQRFKVLLSLYTNCEAGTRQALVEKAMLPRWVGIPTGFV